MSAEITQEIDKALKGLGSEILKETLDALHLQAKGSTVASYLTAYKEGISEKGIDHLVNSYDEAGLKEIAEALGITSEHKKKFMDSFRAKGIESFLKTAKESTLTGFAKVLKLESDSKDEMEKIILEEMLMTGTKDLLTSLNVALLKKYCQKLNLKESTKKADLVSTIMDHVFQLEPEEEAKPSTPKKDDKKGEKASPAKSKRGEKKAAASPAKEKESTKRKKPSPSPPPPSSRSRSPARGSEKEKEKKTTPKAAAPQKKAKTTTTTTAAAAAPRPPISGIKKGLTYTDIYDTWNATDLRDYCREKGLKITGKKKDIIKRVLAFLETGVVADDTKKKKPKANAKKTKKAAAKKDTTSSTTTTSTTATEAALVEAAGNKKKESGKKAAATETKK
eukprot:TRINITY_DN623_c0_g1_i1.p1 TRINITY_DN623_c0_g1~~TRINITY_DN623_c0_g1_i1.p1  ORF type:complete len:393 (-),score=189.47 TRINITY_DN623_c0_g1_i1:75-1253(-)